MSFIVKDKKLLKSYTKIWETIEKLMKINFESNPVYGVNVKYIKTKIKTCRQHKSTIYMFINNNDRFSYKGK